LHPFRGDLVVTGRNKEISRREPLAWKKRFMLEEAASHREAIQQITTQDPIHSVKPRMAKFIPRKEEELEKIRDNSEYDRFSGCRGKTTGLLSSTCSKKKNEVAIYYCACTEVSTCARDVQK